MSDTILVAIITACATFIPTISSIIITNYYQLKLKRFELNEIAKQDVVIEFLETIGNFSYKTNSQDISEYLKCTSKLLYYFPNLDINLLVDITSASIETTLIAKINKILPIIKELSKSRKEL